MINPRSVNVEVRTMLKYPRSCSSIARGRREKYTPTGAENHIPPKETTKLASGVSMMRMTQRTLEPHAKGTLLGRFNGSYRNAAFNALGKE